MQIYEGIATLKTSSAPPFSWKNCSQSCGNYGPPSTQGRTLFEGRGIPQQIAELETKTQDPNLWSDQQQAQSLFAKLKTLKKQWEPLHSFSKEIEGLIELLEETGDTAALEDDARKLFTAWETIETQLYLSGEFDVGNCYLTISGGAGGTEAQDWAGILLRMYLRYTERQGWKTTIIEETPGQEAGVKSVTVLVEGEMAYGYLKCERGTHRLVRLSPFNAKNLRQTSFALVEVLPVIEESDEVQIDAGDLRVDTYRSGGAGGQHVNKTDSAVRLTHLPTGIVVACQSERSQQQNRAQAMNMLRAKILEKKRAEDTEKKESLKGARKSADFGQQIRSYVLHPYHMVKDLRTDTETSDTDAVLDGDLQKFIDAELKRIARS